MPKRIRFLTALAGGNSVTKACQLADISRRTVYYWRDEDGEFAEEWDDALNASVEELEDEVRTRALNREDPKSHILLIFLLKKHRPEYRENYAVKKDVTIHHVKEFEFSDEEIGDAIEILNAAKGEVPSAEQKVEPSEENKATSQEPDESE